MPLFTKSRKGGGAARILVVTDLHGFEVAFRKFLNAVLAYRVDHLICGGDLVGKRLYPIVDANNGTHRCSFRGYTETFTGEDGLAEIKYLIEMRGGYHVVRSQAEVDELEQDPAALDQAFTVSARERLARWMALAKERLGGTEAGSYFTGGNDDTVDMLEPLLEVDGDHVVACEDRIVDIQGHQMVSIGLSNPTPSDTPCEVPEDELADEIERRVASVEDLSSAIFNIHVPPKDSGLDTCPALDTSEWPPKPILKGGEQIMAGAESVAVSDAIRKYQPLLSLHGHIHESPAIVDIGRTKSINPGSDYQDGTLRGAVVALRGSRVTGFQLTNG